MSPSVVQIVTPSGVGTGFVVDEYDRVITNAHVVGRRETVEVRSSDGRTYEGKVLGIDEDADLALISLGYAANLKPLALGYSDQVDVGDEVIAMGFPLSDRFGDSLTVTKGIVSAKRTSEDGLALLQTDAAINPGNSGGPLVGRDRRVVGVSSSKLFRSSDGRPLEGISLAIAINETRARLQSLARGKNVLSDTYDKFGSRKLASALETILPQSFEQLDTEDEGFGLGFWEDDDVFSDSVLYGSADPFQMVIVGTGELDDSERFGLDVALSNFKVVEDAFIEAIEEEAAAEADGSIESLEVLDPLPVGDGSVVLRMDYEFDEVDLRLDMVMFLRKNLIVVVLSAYFQEVNPAISVEDVAVSLAGAVMDAED